MKSFSGKEILMRFMELAPYLNSITTEEFGVSVILGDRYLTYVPCDSLNLGIQAGDSIKSPAVQRCMITGKPVVRMFTEETSKFGVPYIAYAVPVMENDQVIGCVVTTQTISSQEEAKAIAADLAAASEELTVDVEELGAQQSEISKVGKTIEMLSAQMAEDLQRPKELNAAELIYCLKESVGAMNKLIADHDFAIRSMETAIQNFTSMAVRLSSVIDKKNVTTAT